MSKVTPKVIAVSVSLALFLWASFNILDLLVATTAGSDINLQVMIYSSVQVFALLVIVYFGATSKLFSR